MQVRKTSHAETLGKMIANDAAITAELAVILRAFQELGIAFKDNNLEKLRALCEAKGLQVQLLNPEGVGNNKNVLLQSPQGSLIIQLCSKQFASAKAIDALLEHSNQRPEWLHVSFFHLKQFEAGIQENDRGREVQLTVMHAYPHNIDRLAARNRETADQTAVLTSVAKVAGQLSEVLTDLAAINVFWTDLKPGNILLDENFDVKIADSKGFSLASELRIHGRTKNISFDELTAAFLSSANQDRMFQLPESELGSVIKIWEQEYSYQLAIILYRVATGDLTDPQVVNGRNHMPFNFNQPFFQSEAGQKFKEIIEKLSAENPDARMSFHNASIKLNKLVEFSKGKTYSAMSSDQRIEAYLNAETPKEQGIIIRSMSHDEKVEAGRKAVLKMDAARKEELRAAGPAERQRAYLDPAPNTKDKALSWAMMSEAERIVAIDLEAAVRERAAVEGHAPAKSKSDPGEKDVVRGLIDDFSPPPEKKEGNTKRIMGALKGTMKQLRKTISSGPGKEDIVKDRKQKNRDEKSPIIEHIADDEPRATSPRGGKK